MRESTGSYSADSGQESVTVKLTGFGGRQLDSRGWRAAYIRGIKAAGCVGPAHEVDGIQALKFAGFDDAIDHAVPPCAFLGIAPEGDFAADHHGADLPLGSVVVELDIGVRDEADQILAVLIDSLLQRDGLAFGDRHCG